MRQEPLPGRPSPVQPPFCRIPALIWTIDRDLRFTFSDGAVLNGTGYAPNEAVGLTLPQWIQSDDPELPPVRVHRQALDGIAGSYTSEWNGRLFHVRVEPLQDPAGAILGAIAVAVDVSERKGTEEAFRISEERFRLVCEHSPIALGIGQRGKILYVNGAWLRMFGYSDPEEVLGMDVLRTIAPECRGDIETKMRRRETGQDVPTSYDTVGLRKDGTRFLYHVDVARIPLHGGEGSFVFGRDISAEKRAEEELRTSVRQLRDAERIGKIGSWEWDYLTDRVSWSDELYPIFGLEPREFVPNLARYLEFVHPEDRARVEALIQKAYRESGILAYECRILRPDRSMRTIDVRGQVLSDPEGRSLRMVGVVADVTERIATQQALMAARADLEARVEQRTAELARANSALIQQIEERKRAQEQVIRSEKLASIGMLLSGVGHEINNPLNVISGNLELLTERGRLKAIGGNGSREGRKIRSMLRDASRAARRARMIVETFRQFARDVRHSEWVDLNECVKEALLVSRKDVRSSARTRTKLGAIPKVLCYRAQMVLAFVNLLRNAYEAVGKKGTVAVETRRVRGAVQIKISDSGGGIPPEIRSRLFEPFLTTKPPGKGLGLGLSISAAIVQNHRGTIRASTGRTRGTEFRIRIPAPPQERA